MVAIDAISRSTGLTRCEIPGAEDYPEKRRNLRVTGLRGVGKTVLLKEYERIARRHEWVVVRRDWSTRFCEEVDFATALAGYLTEAVEALSVKARIKKRVTTAMEAIGQVQLQIADGVSVSVRAGSEQAAPALLEDRLREALMRIGEVAQAQARGVALLFDQAHTVYDRQASSTATITACTPTPRRCSATSCVADTRDSKRTSSTSVPPI